jgi:hypothetical protein
VFISQWIRPPEAWRAFFWMPSFETMLCVEIVIRSATSEPLPDGSILGALRRQDVFVHRADITRDGMTILCKGEVRTLRLCAEQLASLSFVSGLSMQRCEEPDA